MVGERMGVEILVDTHTSVWCNDCISIKYLIRSFAFNAIFVGVICCGAFAAFAWWH